MLSDEVRARFGDDPERLIRENLASVEERICAACARAGRHRTSVTLLPVTKTVPSDVLRLAARAGITVMAENKIQEAQGKSTEMADLGITWKIVGHLQTNKIKPMVSFASEFQALDSLRLAGLLNEALVEAGRTLDVYVQINTSGEASKYGITPGETPIFVEKLRAFGALKPKGLMTLARLNGTQAEIGICFDRLMRLRDRLLVTNPGCGLTLLSMGMTNDFELAIAHGADIVRVGRAIFGPRPTKDGHFWPGLLPA